MSTRETKLLFFDRIHIFRDMVGVNIDTKRNVGVGYYIDVGAASYNRAWKIWPPTFRRLY